MKRRWMVAAVCAGLASVIGGLAGVAPVGAEASALDASGVVAAADAASGAAAGPTSVTGDGVTADVAGGAVTVPLAGDGALAVDPDSGPGLSIGIPGGSEAQGEVVAGNVVYADVAAGSSVVARPVEGGVQALVVIDGPEAPTRFRFPIEVGGRPARLRAAAGGAVEVRSAGSSEIVSLIEPAWARDARGASVETRYRIDGSTLVQVVDHRGAAYPVVADPKTCGVVTCTYYFGKKATKDVASGASAGALCSGVLKVLPVAAAGCGAAVAALAVQANRAKNRGMCLKVKYAKGPFPVWYPDIYSGSYCK